MKILIMALLVTACIKNGGEAVEEPLLKDFALKVNELSYHANLDKESGMATIGVIEYGGYVSGVSVDLADGATISPNPNDFLGSWPQSQEFIVSKGEVSQKWTVRLTKYVSELPQIDGKDVIFRDEFDTDGEVNSEFWSLIGKGTAGPESSSWMTVTTQDRRSG